MAAAGVIDQNTPHRLGGDRKKLAAIFPIDGVLAGEPQIRFVNEGGRRERFGVLVTQQIAGDAAQFVIDDRQQLVESVLFPVTPILQ